MGSNPFVLISQRCSNSLVDLEIRPHSVSELEDMGYSAMFRDLPKLRRLRCPEFTITETVFQSLGHCAELRNIQFVYVIPLYFIITTHFISDTELSKIEEMSAT